MFLAAEVERLGGRCRKVQSLTTSATSNNQCLPVAFAMAMVLLVVITVGCRSDPFYMDEPAAELPANLSVANDLQNPFVVSNIDREFLWNQIVDAVDDYFEIDREQRVQNLDGVIMEGRLETHPLPGATVLEPWRLDSTPGFEKAYATLQSIRRQATVRVVPVSAGYSIHVIVQQELEDVDRPAFSTPGSSIPRHDGTIVRAKGELDEEPITLGWIGVGRDAALENEIIQHIRGRLADGSPSAPLDRAGY